MRIGTGLMLLAALAATPAAAQSLEERLRDQLRATTTQLREAQASLATAQAATAAAEKERDAARARVVAAPPVDSGALTAARGETAAARARAGSAEAAQANAEARAAMLRTELAAARADVAQQRAAAANVSTGTARLQTALDACAAHNIALVTTGNELVAVHLQRFGNGLFPPLQLARTDFENAAQAYGDRIAAERYTAPANAVNALPQSDSATKPQ